MTPDIPHLTPHGMRSEENLWRDVITRMGSQSHTLNIINTVLSHLVHLCQIAVKNRKYSVEHSGLAFEYQFGTCHPDIAGSQINYYGSLLYFPYCTQLNILKITS